MRKAKRIEIVSAEQGCWYYNLIGCIFKVVGEVEEAYRVIVGNIGNKYSVEKNHAKVVERIEPPYADKQARWIKENNLKVGDKIKMAYKLKPYRNGFEYHNVACIPGTMRAIKSITDDYIKLEGISYPVPYFRLEPVVDEWQPCETMEEKLVFVREMVRDKNDYESIDTITGLCSGGFTFKNSTYSAKTMFENYECLDGSPIGVNKVKELLE